MFRFLAVLGSFAVLCIASSGVLEPDTLDGLSRPLLAGDLIIVGGKNAFYVINGTREEKVDWPPSNEASCRDLLYDEQECQNYVTVLKLDGKGILIVHGTNARSPVQRTYQINETGIPLLLKEEEVVRATSFFQQQESLFLEINKTVDFTAGFDNLEKAQICKNGHVCTPSGRPLFSDPKFLKLITSGKYVYTVFMDKLTQRTYIMRVCIDDITTSLSGSERLSTFITMELECSLLDLHYTKLVAVSEVYNTTCNNDKPCTAFPGVFLAELPTQKRYSATVCQFNFEEIDHIFDEGIFANKTAPVNNEEVPNPRPGHCQFGSTFLNNDHQMLQAAEGLPILSTEGFPVSAISIDQVKADNGNPYQIFYLGTSEGSLLRYTTKNGKAESFKEMQKLPGGQPVRYIGWQNKEKETSKRRLVISTATEVIQIEPYRCCNEDPESCASCVGQHDPKCAWNNRTKSCLPQETTVMGTTGLGLISSTTGTPMSKENPTTPGVTQPKGEKSGKLSTGSIVGIVIVLVGLVMLGVYYLCKKFLPSRPQFAPVGQREEPEN